MKIARTASIPSKPKRELNIGLSVTQLARALNILRRTYAVSGRTSMNTARAFEVRGVILPMHRENVPNPVVLVVDDEALIRWSLSEALAEFGYEVRQAASGVEAIEALKRCATDPLVVLLDLRLPDVADLSLL